MPQMKPMNWIYLMIYFLTSFLTLNTFIYYNITPAPASSSSTSIFPPSTVNFKMKW